MHPCPPSGYAPGRFHPTTATIATLKVGRMAGSVTTAQHSPAICRTPMMGQMARSIMRLTTAISH